MVEPSLIRAVIVLSPPASGVVFQDLNGRGDCKALQWLRGCVIEFDFYRFPFESDTYVIDCRIKEWLVPSPVFAASLTVS